MLRCEEYLVKYGTIDIPHYSLHRIRNLEKVRTVENIRLMKIPESYYSELGHILLPLAIAALCESFSLYVSISLVLNPMQFIHFCEEVLLLVELLINNLFFPHKKRCRLFFKQLLLLCIGTFIIFVCFAAVTVSIFIKVFFIAWMILLVFGWDEMVPLILLWKANFFGCVLIQGQDALNQLHCDALVVILWVRNALMELTELEWELLLICFSLLFNGSLYEFLALHSVGFFLQPFSLPIFFWLLTKVFEGRRLVHVRAYLLWHIRCITSLQFVIPFEIILW